MNDHTTPQAARAGTLTIGGDLRVHRLGYGAMRLTGPGIWGPPKDPSSAQRVLQRAVELGVNFIDTADSYGPEVNESLIAQALHPYPAGLVIASKGGLVRPAAERWDPKADPAHLRRVCEGSLQRLRVERIDLYQLHMPDPRVPIEESLQELGRLQQEGKIRHIGVSNFSVSQLQRAVKVVKVVSVQNRYNIGERGSDDVIEYCERHQMAFIPWYPLAAGDYERSSQLRTISKQHSITPAQAAIAWLLARSPVVLPIPGTSSIDHLEENVGAAAVKL